MLKISSNKEDLKYYLNSFIWTYKIGDNILYNLEVITQLAENHDRSEGRNYSKPISILCISVIEAILVDFLERLDLATYHFPNKLNSKRAQIKNALDCEKNEYQTTFKGEIYQYRKLRNFGYKELIELCEKFNILGPSPIIYKSLQNLGYFRNRVHIRNYFGNFERDESRTFSELRTQRTIDYMERIFTYFSQNYSRP